MRIMRIMKLACEIIVFRALLGRHFCRSHLARCRRASGMVGDGSSAGDRYGRAVQQPRACEHRPGEMDGEKRIGSVASLGTGVRASDRDGPRGARENHSELERSDHRRGESGAACSASHRTVESDLSTVLRSPPFVGPRVARMRGRLTERRMPGPIIHGHPSLRMTRTSRWQTSASSRPYFH